MELIKSAARRSKWSDVVYILLNVIYALALFVLVSPDLAGLPYLAYILVFMSKWRVIAVRPRFWFANVQANLIDFMVGISVVTLMLLTAAATPWVAILLSFMYVFWLLVIKPHTVQKWILIQAGIGQFISLMALFSLAHNFEFKPFITDSTILTVLIAWLIGYSSARHALSAFKNEEERSFLSLAWGFVVAELAWLAHHWTIAYSIYNAAGVGGDKQLMIPQVAIILTLMGFIAIRWYAALHTPDNKKLHKEARSASLFAAAVIAILLVFFNGSLDITAL